MIGADVLSLGSALSECRGVRPRFLQPVVGGKCGGDHAAGPGRSNAKFSDIQFLTLMCSLTRKALIASRS